MMKKQIISALVALALGSSLSVMAAGPSESLATLYPDFQVASIQYLDFTDHNRDEAVVTGRIFGHPYEPSHIGAIMAYDDATQGWKPLYVTEKMYMPVVVSTGRVLPQEEKQVLFREWEGSGSFLHYEVMAWNHGKTEPILTRSQIPQGNALFYDGKILETQYSMDTFYTWNGTQLVRKELPQQLPVQATHRITYTIDEDHHVTMSATSLTMKIGDTLQLRRMNRGVGERILTSGDYFDFSQRGVMKAKVAGKTDITMIPDSYDWDHAATITVTILP